MVPPNMTDYIPSTTIALQEGRHSKSDATHLPLNSKDQSFEQHNPCQNFRSRGWVPLSFPRTAVLDSALFHGMAPTTATTTNQYFPLHRDILLAAVRELLLLDGTLDPFTLRVRNETANFLRTGGGLNSTTTPSNSQQLSSPADISSSIFVKAPRFLCHLEPLRWLLAPEPKRKKGSKKKQASSSRPRKRKQTNDGRKGRSAIKIQKISGTNDGGELTSKQRDDLDLIPRQQRDDTDSKPRDAAVDPILNRNGDENSTLQKQGSRADDDNERTTKQAVPLDISSMDDQPDLVDEDMPNLHRIDTPMAEYVAECITRRCFTFENSTSHAIQGGSETCMLTKLSDDEQKLPRKVSDVDQDLMGFNAKDTLMTAFMTEEVMGDRDISRFVNLSERAADGAFPLKQANLPALLDASIATESALRDEAVRMTTALTASFDDAALRLFLGYKVPTLKRGRLVQVLADFLFDASHAMFAWDQTMQELLTSKSLVEPLSSKEWKELDDMARNSLFDERALRKIGGFDSSSLVPHAISIARLSKRGISWEAFAKTSDGRRLLTHHRVGDKILVGQKRRGQRQRNRSFLLLDQSSTKVPRSRCPSVASSDVDGLVSDESVPEFFADVPSTSQVHLVREEGVSWGILLARESDMCLVARVGGNVTPAAKTGDKQLRCGDMILRCSNERGETACSPFFSTRQSLEQQQQEQSTGWFRNIVDMFKSSKELNLAIQRVGG